METNHRKQYMVLFCIYSIFMLFLLFNRTGGIEGVDYWEQVQEKLCLKPFRTITLFLKALNKPGYSFKSLINLGGNVIMFIPLGFFLPRVFPRFQKLWRTILLTTLIITVVELTQLFTLLGVCDIDDLTLNVMGAIIGYIIHKLIK